MSDCSYIVGVTDGIVVTIPCGSCGCPTIHEVKTSLHERGDVSERFYHFSWSKHFQIVQCRGCETVSFRSTESNSEDTDFTDGSWLITEKLYPQRLDRLKGLDNADLLPPLVKSVYDETRTALSIPSPVLTGIGLRAILDLVCRDQAAQGRDLNQKIDGLVAMGLLTSDSADILHSIRTLGNDAAHEGKPYGIGQLLVAMEIVEHVLKGAYIIPALAREHLPEAKGKDGRVRAALPPEPSPPPL